MTNKGWKVVLKEKQGDLDTITVPERVFNQLDHPSRIKMQVGPKSLDMVCEGNDTDREVEIPESIRCRLGLLHGAECHVCVTDDMLRFGPLIGVFVGQTYIERLLQKQNPKNRTKELIKANLEAGTILYFFSVEDVDGKDQTIQGTYFNEQDQRWYTMRFPFPDVLYDRGSGRRKKSPKYGEVRAIFDQHASIRKLNATHYFNKWELHKRLSQYDDMRRYLPYTKLYRHPNDFKSFQKANKVYIKRSVSSNGRKVMRVVKLPKKGYWFSYYTHRVIEGKADGIQDVITRMNRFFHGKKVIIQEAINLPIVNGSIVDMRATVQRNGQDHLEITAIAARIGSKRSPVTSTRTGSKCYPFEDVLRNVLKYSNSRIERLKPRVQKFLVTTYHCIEQSFGPFGEIGIDFAIDTSGKIWFIEGNAKPAKAALYQSYDDETIRKAFRYPLEYAKYISGF